MSQVIDMLWEFNYVIGFFIRTDPTLDSNSFTKSFQHLTSQRIVLCLRCNEISPALQKIIWNLPHSATNHFPGKLSLCIGIPVIIRNNDATELCITKGQEGHVYNVYNVISAFITG